MIEARKVTFQEAWNTTTVFFVDDGLEDEIDAEVEVLLGIAQDARIAENTPIDENAITEFLIEHERALDVILNQVISIRQK